MEIIVKYKYIFDTHIHKGLIRIIFLLNGIYYLTYIDGDSILFRELYYYESKTMSLVKVSDTYIDFFTISSRKELLSYPLKTYNCNKVNFGPSNDFGRFIIPIIKKHLRNRKITQLKLNGNTNEI